MRGQENFMTMKEFRSQLLAEEAIVDSHNNGQFLSAMIANSSTTMSKWSNLSGGGQSYHNSEGQFYGGFRSFTNKNKGKNKFHVAQRYHNPRPMYPTQTHGLPTPTPGVLGPSPNQFGSPSAPLLQTRQLCNADGHTAPYCFNKSSDR